VLLVTLTHLPPDAAAVEATVKVARGDKTAHAAGYAVLAVLVFGVCQAGKTRRAELLILAALAVGAAGDEWTQPYCGRSAELQDWAVDTLGLVLGYLGVALLSILGIHRRRTGHLDRGEDRAGNSGRTHSPERFANVGSRR
jgi:VanZ family protein